MFSEAKMTYLAAPIAAKDLAAAREQLQRAKAGGAEMLELRMDYLDGLTSERAHALIAMAKETRLSVIVTCRDKAEGGANYYPQEQRTEVLVTAVSAGAEFIDCEFENFQDPVVQEKLSLALASTMHTRLILSSHAFDGPFENIGRLYRDILATFPAAVPKLVYAAKHINDCFAAIELLKHKHTDAIVLAMGEAGVITRLLAPKLGGLVTYACLNSDTSTAPGQLRLEDFIDLYHCNSINAGTELFGVIASPVGHSMSPAIHNAGFVAAKVDGLYLPLLVEGGKAGFDAFMQNALASRIGFKGFSVTIPHKENALNFIKARGGRIDPLSEKIGAVNTVIVEKDGMLSGYNTDYAGALGAVTGTLGISRKDLRGWPVAVVGAGGVARAIVAGFGDAGARITIYNRTVSKAKTLARDFDCDYAPIERLSEMNAKLLINCTSVGMYPKVGEAPVPANYLRGDMTVFDTVYNPLDTLLLQHARAAGARTVDGVAMFVGQAMAQFHLFTGKEASVETMRKVVLSRLGGR
jgi:3-dehydroquinate dehydratase/shikimate dehydrogenase